jgi:hypothetical protein
LFADQVCKLALAPYIHFANCTACICDPTFYSLDYFVKSGLIQIGLDDANQFIITHEGNLLSTGLLLFDTVGKPGAERHDIMPIKGIETYLSGR